MEFVTWPPFFDIKCFGGRSKLFLHCWVSLQGKKSKKFVAALYTFVSAGIVYTWKKGKHMDSCSPTCVSVGRLAACSGIQNSESAAAQTPVTSQDNSTSRGRRHRSRWTGAPHGQWLWLSWFGFDWTGSNSCLEHCGRREGGEIGGERMIAMFSIKNIYHTLFSIGTALAQDQ